MTPAAISLADLIERSGASLVSGDPKTPITSVHYDSRSVRPGGLFVALRGEYVDGHDFLEDARSRGAVAALVEPDRDATGFQALAAVNNTRRALSPVAARFYGNPGDSLGVVGVTGTDGKTTTGYLIDALLRSAGFRTGLIGTVAIRVANSVIEHDTRQTTPESLEVQRLLAGMREYRVNWAVIEATSHALALYRLDDCPFDIGVVTNVTREHLDFHGTIEAYRAAKARLIERVESSEDRPYPRGAVLNADDEGARIIGAKATTVPVTWFSVSDRSASLYADRVFVHSSGTTFDLHAGPDTVTVNLKLIGRYNVFNAMAAAGVGLILGMDLDAIGHGLESLSGVPGRMQRIDMGQPFNVIVDYAHSPASLEQTLDLARSVTDGRLIAVSGSAGERDQGKRPVQGEVSARMAEFSIFTSEDPRFEDPVQILRDIAAGAESAGGKQSVDFVIVENRRDAIELAIDSAQPGDTVLLAGKGHETCMIYGDLRVPWNEALEVSDALRRRGFHEADRE